MLYDEFRYPMPKKQVLLKRRKDSGIYVYLNTNPHRNKQGKPTSNQIAIGKKDEVTGDLIPNAKYFEIFPENKPAQLPNKQEKRKKAKFINTELIENAQIKSCGVPAVVLEVAKQIGLLDVLQKSSPHKWESILATACYMISQGNVMMYIEDWFDVTKVGFSDRLKDTDCSALFASITDSERRSFFTEWIQKHSDQMFLVYDVSSLSTYSKNIEKAELGYNRDGEYSPQVNFGMLYGLTSRLPLYYELYNGSIPDVSCLEYMMTNAQDFGIKDVNFVFDCGFLSEDNFFFMTDHQYPFITSLPKHRKEAIQLIDEVKGKMEKNAYRIKDYKVFGVERSVVLFGQKIRAHVYYDPEKKASDIDDIYSEFVLLDIDVNLSSQEVLKIYRERDVIEKSFHQFKNELDFRRLKTQRAKTTEGKMFVGYLALIIRTFMQNTLKKNEYTKQFTFEKILLELKKINSLRLNDDREITLSLTKLQKIILMALNVDINLLKSV
jgi:hypothetical protein